MKTTAKALVGWIAIAIVLSARIAVAAPIGYTPHLWLAASAVGQSATTAGVPDDKGQQTADLLRRARQAMAENDLAAADSLISQAESLGVQFNALYMGDTPKKARRDLDRKRNVPGTTAAKPGQPFGALGMNKNKQAPTADPFVGQVAAAAPAAPTAGQITPLPRVEGAAPIPTLGAQPNPAAMPMTPDQAARPVDPALMDARLPAGFNPNMAPPAGNAPTAAAGNSPLRAARLSLAVGDVRRAAEQLQQAKAMQVTYQPLDDTPDKVEAALRKYQEMTALDKSTEAYRRAYARNLMEQADALLRWGEQDEAERLAGRAAGMQVVYGPFEQKPQDLLQRIAASRRSGANGSSAATPGFATATPTPTVATRQKAVELVRQAREAIAANQLDRAEVLARQAEQLHLPDAAFAPGEDRPGLVMLDLRQIRQRGAASGVVQAGAQYVTQAGGTGEPDRMAASAVYDPSNDPTRNVAASSTQALARTDPRMAQKPQPTLAGPPTPPPDPSVIPTPSATPQTPAMALFEQGEAALKAHDTTRAYEFFRQASLRTNELDPATAQRLQDHMQLLAAPAHVKPQPQPGQSPTMADETALRQQTLARQIGMDLAQKETAAKKLRETDPNGALAMLDDARKKIEASGLDNALRDQLLRRADRAITETKQYIDQNRPQLELAQKNARVHQEVDREQRMKVEVDEKLALLIDEFNRLVDEERFEEAQVVAKRAAELAPDNPVVVQLQWQGKFLRRFAEAKDIESRKEDGFVRALNNSELASIPFDDNNPIVFPEAKEWDKLSQNRRKLAQLQRRQRSEREIQIDKKLRTPVSLQFTNAPLSKVLENLAKLAEVNLHIDPQGLTEEGVTTDTPVTIELREEIMLKSALNLILEPLHLSYVVKDEVLKITSEQMRDGQVYTVTYNVADLVVPIPNFVPTDMGIQSAYNSAMAHVGFGGSGVPFGSSQSTPLAVVASKNGGSSNAALNPTMLAQQMGSSPTSVPGMPKNTPVGGAGPGSLGGGTQADFDSLIELITSTVKPTSWDSVGGPGSIAPFETNLSLVISQTQEVHDEIDDLLKQLRRLQDLQVTIEVRFITLNDNFFERIGVSFDFAVNDNIDGKNVSFGKVTGYPDSSGLATGQGVPRNVMNQDSNRTVTVGLSAPNVFNADLDVPFTQNSYALAVPQFGGFDATAGASLGFAILSDIEAYFFINAAQGDKRSNVLQAPKVTLFNGQQAYVSDTSQSPFVISVIPVVGDFAAAQQPVIVVLSEGTFMTVQAVVSADRRFVRLTVVPFFSHIGDVKTFQFTGSQSTTVDTTREGLQSAATDPSKLWNKKGDNVQTTNTGTTVQLPTFSFVTVTTTVSVPDGGTVLLGGIKRLSEGRNEFGVPLLNKLPYINRLFKNVGIGRETQSLMMMVTPRIIIQEEEEEKIGVQPPQP